VIELGYQREIPYPPSVLLSQYFDLEHLEHVHPESLGRARMVSSLDRLIVWDLEWPLWGGFRLRSRFEQEYVPPWGIRARIVRGALRGTESTVQLSDCSGGTLVEEEHRVALPDWPILRTFIERTWIRRLDRIWEEDLAVKMCRGGWPGVPGRPWLEGSSAREQISGPTG
jgi:hypothetical protein